MGLKRNLSCEEILEQVLVAGRITRESDRRLRNVVFMGMGEPLDNQAALHEALAKLRHQQWFGFPGHRLVVSTVGVPTAMRRLVDRFPELQFALSLHSARPELRSKLIPWSRRHSWSELRDALHYVSEKQKECPQARPIMIEHLLLDGINDADEDARRINRLCRRNQCPHELDPIQSDSKRSTLAANTETQTRSIRGPFETSRVLRDHPLFHGIGYSSRLWPTSTVIV